MSHDAFSTPVQLLLGLGIPRPVSNVVQAYAILCDLPRAEAPLEYDRASDVCLSAIRRTATGEQARTAFVRFAMASGRHVTAVEPDIAPAPVRASPIAA